MSSGRQLILIAGVFAVALVASALLYARSQSADFDRHARAVETLGTVRHLNEHLSQQVLAARFGLLNQYDPITSTELALTDAGHSMRQRIADVVPVEGSLAQAIERLDAAISRQRGAVELFKTENSLLKNSIYYLPTAAREAGSVLATPSSELRGTSAAQTSLAIHRLAEAALVYNLVGDQSARGAHQRALSELKQQRARIADSALPSVESLLSHAAVIDQKQPNVDLRVKQVVDSDVNAYLQIVEHEYHQRFAQTVSVSNRYRKVLYGWSLLLVVAVAAAGLQLRRLYADLEHRVTVRTAELRRALAALWGEMKLARKIQEALLPADPRLRDCEIAACMKPTDEVGGDYYDVIHAGDREWILIGDVSGHGVPAGLVMMMCQTAVRTVLRADPNVMPDKLLSTVNSVLTENIRQLGEDKYMTISALRREPDGTVLFAGAHQDILLYRAETASVETVETAGLWLGIKDEIADALETRSFRLEPGDLCVLYTDGITEASRDGELFEPASVRRVLERAGSSSAEHVLSELFAELRPFQLSDDATVLVLRQLGDQVGACAGARDSETAIDAGR